MGMCISSGKAQGLDGESEMRGEGGNEAVDADAMWDEEPGWNTTSGEQGSSTNGITEGEFAADKVGKLSKDTELDGLRSQRETDSSGVSSAVGVDEDRERNGIEEELNNGQYGSVHPAVVESVGSSSVSGAVPQGSSISADLNGHVSSFAAAAAEVNVTTTSGVNGGEASCSLTRPMGVDTEVNSDSRLQFFVRTYIAGHTVVLNASASDSIESVHQQIYRKTGLPVSEQRLIFGGRQLQHEQTLKSYNVGNDSTLNLVARMRSVALPRLWLIMNTVVANIRQMCAVEDEQTPDAVKLLRELQAFVRPLLQEFLKMASKSVRMSEHMQVFRFAGAPSALVRLLLSKIESNRKFATESITDVLLAIHVDLPAHIPEYCISVSLDFCKLLLKSAPNHTLYSSCRHSLAQLLRTVDIAHESPYFYEAKPDSIVLDLFPLVNELSLLQLTNLQFIAKTYKTKEGTINFGPYVKEATEFAAFVIALCQALEVFKGIDLYGSTGLTISRSRRCNGCPILRYSGQELIVSQLSWLRAFFFDLLKGVDYCLKAVGKDAEKSSGRQAAVIPEDRGRHLELAPFLIILLKGLRAIAKVYDGAMEPFMDVLGRRSIALNTLIRQSKLQLDWQDDDFWLLEYKNLLDFESKRKLVMTMLPEPRDDDKKKIINLHRAQLLSQSFESFEYGDSDLLQGGISVYFSGEEATGPGVLREWFSMICREIFDCQYALFLPCPKDRRRFFPNPASGVHLSHLTYFRFCGRVIALALMHKVQVDVTFALTFFKQLAGLPISWEDAKDADPMLYESCKKILEMDPDAIDALGLTFVSEVEELGTRKTVELCHGGRELVVTSENRRRFVEFLVHRRLVASVADQIKSFSLGFSDLLVRGTPQQFLRRLAPEDLDLMVHGNDRNLCLKDWKMHTEYHGYKSTDKQIKWFWKVVESMTPEQQRRLLFFSTSVTHLPAEGFAGLSSKFHIHRAHTDKKWLPTAHTCFYELLLPAYRTRKILHSRLQAITEPHIAEGFGFA